MMRAQRTTDRDERAVSEAISYVLVFALITIGGVLVVFQGIPAISDAQDEQVVENSERAVKLIQDRVDEMVRQDSPRREVSVNLQDIRLGIGDMEPSRVRVTVTEDATGNTVDLADLETDPVYIKTSAGGLEQTAAYENGAVLVGRRGFPDTWTMTRRPSWGFTTNSSTEKVERVFMRTVSTTGSGGVGGSQTARVLFETTSGEDETLTIDELEVSVESPRSGAWERYFERVENGIQGADISTSGDRVTLTLNEFEGGSGTIVHRERVIRTEVKAR